MIEKNSLDRLRAVMGLRLYAEELGFPPGGWGQRHGMDARALADPDLHGRLHEGFDIAMQALALMYKNEKIPDVKGIDYDGAPVIGAALYAGPMNHYREVLEGVYLDEAKRFVVHDLGGSFHKGDVYFKNKPLSDAELIGIARSAILTDEYSPFWERACDCIQHGEKVPMIDVGAYFPKPEQIMIKDEMTRAKPKPAKRQGPPDFKSMTHEERCNDPSFVVVNDKALPYDYQKYKLDDELDPRFFDRLGLEYPKGSPPYLQLAESHGFFETSVTPEEYLMKDPRHQYYHVLGDDGLITSEFGL